MTSTSKKLEKDMSWRKVYETQLRNLVGRGFAREVSAEKIDDWKSEGGKTYYISPDGPKSPVKVYPSQDSL